MKATFLIDENAFIHAWTAQDDSGAPYWAPAQLMMNIAANCHRIVLFTELQTRYSIHVESLRRAGKTPLLNMPAMINQLMRNAEKISYLDHILGVKLPPCIKNDDDFLVRASIQTQAILVTDDGPLLDCVRDEDLSVKYNLKAMRPIDAMTYSH